MLDAESKHLLILIAANRQCLLKTMLSLVLAYHNYHQLTVKMDANLPEWAFTPAEENVNSDNVFTLCKFLNSIRWVEEENALPQ